MPSCGVLDVADRAHLVEDRLQRMEFPVQFRFPYVGHVAADHLGDEKYQQPSLFAELGLVALPVRAHCPLHHGEVLLLLVPQFIVPLGGHRVEIHAVRRVREEPGLPPGPFDLFLVQGETLQFPGFFVVDEVVESVDPLYRGVVVERRPIAVNALQRLSLLLKRDVQVDEFLAPSDGVEVEVKPQPVGLFDVVAFALYWSRHLRRFILR